MTPTGEDGSQSQGGVWRAGRPIRPRGSFAWGPESERPAVAVGEMYWSDTTILRDDRDDLADLKPERPVAVVRAPSEEYPIVTLVVRVDPSAPEARGGVAHPAQPKLGLNKDGVFSKLRKWARWERFCPRRVKQVIVNAPGT